MSTSDRDQRLERWYRLLLLAYPARFRQERAEEIVTTLLAAAKPGGRGLPSIRDAVDLVVNGLRTRVRVTRRTLAAPRTAEASHGAGLVILTIATAAAVALAVAVTVYGRPMFAPGRNFNHTYKLPARLGLAAVLATFPAALAAALTDRARTARLLAVTGATGSIGFAAWLVTYALDTRNEHLEASNLFGLVTLLCLPAALLRRAARPAGQPRHIRRFVTLAALLTAPLVLLVAGHHPGIDDLGDTATALGWAGASDRPRLGAVHDTGLTQGIVATLIVVAAWHLLRGLFRPELHRNGPRRLGVTWTTAVPGEPRHLAVVWALAIPVWGYALGTFLTPMFFRPEVLAQPGQSRLAGLGPHVLELGFVSTVVAALAIVTLGALQRDPHQPA